MAVAALRWTRGNSGWPTSVMRLMMTVLAGVFPRPKPDVCAHPVSVRHAAVDADGETPIMAPYTEPRRQLQRLHVVRSQVQTTCVIPDDPVGRPRRLQRHH